MQQSAEQAVGNGFIEIRKTPHVKWQGIRSDNAVTHHPYGCKEHRRRGIGAYVYGSCAHTRYE